MSLAGCTQYYYLISCTLTLSPFLSCFSDILMLDWDICCGVLHSSLLVAWLCCCCCCCCAGNYWRNPRCQSCHLWQPTHAAFRSLCTNQRTSVGPKSGYSRTVELQPAGTDAARPHVPPRKTSCSSPSPYPVSPPIPIICFRREAFSRVWGLKQMSSVFASFRCEQWTVSPCLCPLSLPPWCLHPLPVETLPLPLLSPLSRTFCFGLWRKSVAQFSLRVCCSCFRKVFFIFFVLLLLLLLARFIAFYSSLSVRCCFCGNEDVEAAVKRCQRGVVRHRGEGGRRGQSGNAICRHVEGLQNCLQLQIFHWEGNERRRGSGAFCFDELLLRMSHWQSANQQKLFNMPDCSCVCVWLMIFLDFV